MNNSGNTGPVKLGIEIYVCLDRLGHPIDTDVVTDLAIQLIENGWVKSTVYWSNPTIEAAVAAVTGPEAASDEADHREDEARLQRASIAQGMEHPDYQQSDNGDGPPLPDPRKRYYPSNLTREIAPATTRPVKPGGVQWESEWVDPDNVKPPTGVVEKVWSGWALNPNQTNIVKMMTGEKGRYTLGITSISNYLKKYGKVKPGQDPSARKHIKPHHLTNSLIRRGLVIEIDRDVFILSPRGAVFAREHLGLEPTPRHDSVDTVKAGA